MEMKLDPTKLRALRESKAWSQAHLAQVSGISLRTVQRIEKSGVASPESVKSLCATFDLSVGDLVSVEQHHRDTVATGSALTSFKITRTDKIASLVSFVIAFAIAFIWTTYG